jgi:hypothetical protein
MISGEVQKSAAPNNEALQIEIEELEPLVAPYVALKIGRNPATGEP